MTGRTVRRVALSLLCAGALAGPAQAQLFGGDELARKQIAEQGRRIDALKEQNDALAARLARIEDAMKSLASSSSGFELAQQLELLRTELRQMRGQIEVLGNDVQQSARRQRDMYVDLDGRLKRLEQSGPAAAGTPAAGAAPAAVASAKPPAPGAPAAAPPAEAGAYEAAQGQRRIGNYQGAIAGFQHFVAQYPKSTLAPRAQYWIGDSYYNLRDFKNAIASQNRLIATYPESSSVPDALLNIASCQIELGDTVGARRTMDGLVTRYPASEAAEKAKRRLATLK
ncbi:MAG: tol-pal system protein YbgF [Burkholderiales bacterium]|nr:tol-pal system protein YbgF [Burkholderiales bacterium]